MRVDVYENIGALKDAKLTFSEPKKVKLLNINKNTVLIRLMMVKRH